MESSNLQALLEQPLIARDELAQKLRVSADTIQSWTSERRIPCFRFGHRSVRYSYPAVVVALARFYTPPEQQWSRRLPKRRQGPIYPPKRTYQTELVLSENQLFFPFVKELFKGGREGEFRDSDGAIFR
jgi:excisionase family DNA binding protein